MHPCHSGRQFRHAFFSNTLNDVVNAPSYLFWLHRLVAPLLYRMSQCLLKHMLPFAAKSCRFRLLTSKAPVQFFFSKFSYLMSVPLWHTLPFRPEKTFLTEEPVLRRCQPFFCVFAVSSSNKSRCDARPSTSNLIWDG